MVIFFGTETSPSSADSSPTIMRKSVVFPAPFGPTRPALSPGLSWNDASTKTSCRPYCLEILLRLIMNARQNAAVGGEISRGRFAHRQWQGACGRDRRDRCDSENKRHRDRGAE